MASCPKIYYALVARKRMVLCSGGQPMGFEQSSQYVLDSLHQAVIMTSYESSNHVFHVIVSDDLTYLCVTDKAFNCQTAFGFLRELESQLISTGLREKAYYVGPYALQQEFGRRMDSLLEMYSTDGKLNCLQEEVNDMAGNVDNNIQQLVRKDNNLEDLTDRTALIAHKTTHFQHSSKKRNLPFCRSCKRWVIIIIVIGLVILLLLVGTAVIVTALKLTGHLNKN